MKKYKLIKEYPDSPKLGEIWDENKSFLPITDFPEFWKKVKDSFKIPNDCQVISFRFKAIPELMYTLNSKGKYSKDSHSKNYTLDEMFHKDECIDNGALEIYSVKRLSDGEIFTIGDHCLQGIIKEIKPLDHRLSFIIQTSYNDTRDVTSIEHLKKLVKKPLFTTEDGVDIYKNTTFYYILAAYEFGWKIVEANSNTKYYFNDVYKLFSTKEAAEEYVLMNKPCLSINDLINNITSVHIDTIKDIVRSKL